MLILFFTSVGPVTTAACTRVDVIKHVIVFKLSIAHDASSLAVKKAVNKIKGIVNSVVYK